MSKILAEKEQQIHKAKIELSVFLSLFSGRVNSGSIIDRQAEFHIS
jgi:hypothetical protein